MLQVGIVTVSDAAESFGQSLERANTQGAHG